MSVNIYEFRENLSSEEHTFLMGVNEITRTRVPFLIVKNALVKSLAYITEYSICCVVSLACDSC